MTILKIVSEISEEVYLDCKARFHGEGGFDLKTLSKDWVELFRNIVFLVIDSCFPEPDDDVRICLSVQIRWMKVICLKENYRCEKSLNGLFPIKTRLK